MTARDQFTCITTVVAKSSCDLTDFACICGNATLAEEIQSCFQAECPVRDALSTHAYSPAATATPETEPRNPPIGR